MDQRDETVPIHTVKLHKGMTMRIDDHASSVRLSGLFVAFVLLAAAPVSFGQDESEAAASAPGDIEEITVTGSRIARPGVDTFYPAVSVGTEELDDNAFTNVADALNEIPAFGAADAVP